MAKTNRQKSKSAHGEAETVVVEAWSPEDLIRIARGGTDEEKIAVMKRAGILTEAGKLAPPYRRNGATSLSRAAEK